MEESRAERRPFYRPEVRWSGLPMGGALERAELMAAGMLGHRKKHRTVA